jgi:hypothetical protein
MLVMMNDVWGRTACSFITRWMTRAKSFLRRLGLFHRIGSILCSVTELSEPSERPLAG